MTTGEFWMGITTVVAVLAGPVIAVIVTRINDDHRADKSRKLEIFRTLMRTRRMPIHFEHVGALNLVEVEFIKHEKVVNAWKGYLHLLEEKLPPAEEKGRFETALKRRDSQLAKLIYEIAQVLKIKVEQLDILEGNYIPQGWQDDDWEQRLVRQNLNKVLSGKSPITIAPHLAIPQHPYPPRPAAQESTSQD